jgi:hypothetical protein
LLALLTAGCAHQNALAPPPFPAFDPDLDAIVDPPPGWGIDRADQTTRYVQRVWVSPSGNTSFGVIRFTLPLPVGEDVALLGFLSEMKRTEGDARLIKRFRDPDRDDRLTFVAEGGRYRVDGIIVTRGRRGWAIYAGTLRLGPRVLDELELAVHARDNTIPGTGS